MLDYMQRFVKQMLQRDSLGQNDINRKIYNTALLKAVHKKLVLYYQKLAPNRAAFNSVKVYSTSFW